LRGSEVDSVERSEAKAHRKQCRATGDRLLYLDDRYRLPVALELITNELQIRQPGQHHGAKNLHETDPATHNGIRIGDPTPYQIAADLGDVPFDESARISVEDQSPRPLDQPVATHSRNAEPALAQRASAAPFPSEPGLDPRTPPC